ncbi:MAG: cytochrome B6, partial [Geobacter sp.]|nr:cytochrome B6 [Geobacter sp.]
MKQTRFGKQDFVKSSPHFFRLIYGALLIFLVLALCGGALLPAPLLGPADPGNPPNPAKSAWFLLWIQELVSYGTFFIYPALA